MNPNEEALAAPGEEPTASADDPSDANSPVAAGPAREAHTSSAMAFTFMAVLVVSFLITIFLIMLFL